MNYRTRFILFIYLSALFFACAPSQELPKPENKIISSAVYGCEAVYTDIPRQFVHAIDASFPGGKSGRFIGITSVYPKRGYIECALLTQEGLVLFEAKGKNEPKIIRSVPPFDSKRLAKGLFDDIRFIFFRPPGKMVSAVPRPSGEKICRYRKGKDQSVDLVVREVGSYTIYRSHRIRRKNRKLTAYYCNKQKPDNPVTDICLMVLTNPDKKGYRLTFNLISQTPVK